MFGLNQIFKPDPYTHIPGKKELAQQLKVSPI